MDTPWIISAACDNTIKIWDRSTSECLSTLEGHSDAVNSIAWSPIVLSLASASDDTTVKIWDLSINECISTLEGHTGGANEVAWSPDGTRLAASDDSTIKIWDPSTGQCVLKLEGHGSCINSIAWSSDSTQIISGSDDRTIKIWNSATGQNISTLEGHSDEVYSVVWSPDALRLASSSNDNTIKLWDEAKGNCILTLDGHEGSVYAIAWSPDMLRLASASNDSTIKIWDTSSGKCIATLEGHGDGDSVMSVSWSPDAAWIVSASGDKTIKTWDPATGQCLSTLEGHGNQVNAVIAVTKIGTLPIDQCTSLLRSNSEKDNSTSEISNYVPKTNDGTQIASCSSDKTVKLWDPETGRCTATLEGHSKGVEWVAWAPDGKHLASASDDCTAKIWDCTTGLCKFNLEHDDGVWCVAWSPDGSKLATSLFNGAITIWDISWDAATTMQATVLKDTNRYTLTIAWSPDGTRIVSGSDDEILRVWDLATGKNTRIPINARTYDVAWSHDSKLFAAGSNNQKVMVYDAATCELKIAFEGHMDCVNVVSWSPDSTRFVSSSDDCTVKLWDPISGSCTASLKGHNEWVRSVSWSPDGLKLVSGSRDTTVKIWDAVKGKCITTLEGHTAGVLSVDWSVRTKPPSPPQPPPDSDADDGLARWMQVFINLQDRLHALESYIDSIAEQGVKAALDSIAKGLAEFNQLIDFWPDYTGDDTTNEKRKAIIQSATDLIQSSVGMVTSAGTGDEAITQLLDIEKELKEMKAQFTKETDAEQAVLDSLGPEIQTAINKMCTDQKAYQEAQSQLLAKVEEVYLGAAVPRHTSHKEIIVLDAVNYTTLLKGKGSLDDLQQADELAYLVLERAEDRVRNLQLREQALRRIHKNRPFVQRAIARAERLISVLRMMTHGLTKEGGRLLAVINLISPAIEKLGTVGEPPYHRPHRRSEDALCTTILKIHRESLIDAAFAESARKAVAQVKDWFDDDIPKSTQDEIDAIVNNPLY
ncbi:WD40-repeat-containing domain protein [Trichoderma barbatum]